jgi:hypothetical protein
MAGIFEIAIAIQGPVRSRVATKRHPLAHVLGCHNHRSIDVA